MKGKQAAADRAKTKICEKSVSYSILYSIVSSSLSEIIENFYFSDSVSDIRQFRRFITPMVLYQI